MNVLIALLGLAALTAALTAVAWLGLRGHADLLPGLYRAPELGWPQGVQEEDPPPNWRWTERPQSATVDDEPEVLARVPLRMVERARRS